MGISAGGRLEHRVSPRLSLSAMAGAISLANDVTALELGVFARYTIVSVGYRLVDFNVGPRLHGPELGLFFTI
jgi:hypothetical protein